jgi:predicted kinase
MSTNVLVVFSGMPGTGKSALAERIAIAQQCSMFSVDPIEAAIVAAGSGARTFESGLAAYLVAEALAGAELARGRDTVVDAVNAMAEAQSLWHELAAKHGARLRVVECTCSEETVHRQRLAMRRRPFGAAFEPSWDAVVARRAEWRPWSVPVLAVDSVMPIESNVASVLAWIAAP